MERRSAGGASVAGLAAVWVRPGEGALAVGDGAMTAPLVDLTGTGAAPSCEDCRRFSGIPKEAAFWRMTAPGDAGDSAKVTVRTLAAGEAGGLPVPSAGFADVPVGGNSGEVHLSATEA